MGTSDRRPYETATALNQALLDECQDNLANRIEMIAEIEVPSNTILASDRAKYVGGVFYPPRVTFPIIQKTVGEWLSGELQFSELKLEVSNVDGEYSRWLPGGADYDGFIGRNVVVKVGLAELASSYTEIFRGKVTDVGGFERNTSTFILTCRNDFDDINTNILPNQVLIDDDWPDIEDSFVGLGVPVIYGDWTAYLRPEAPAVPAFPVNGTNAGVLAGTTDVRCVISSVPLKSVDTSSVTLRRGEDYYTFASSDISIVGGTNNQVIDIQQGNLMIDGSPWQYGAGDEFYLKCVGVDLSGYDDNIVWQARDILIRFGGLASGDFDANWATYRDKSTPTESDIAGVLSRVWIQESQEVLAYALSMLEQVRLEAFISRDQKLKINSLHLDDFEASPSYEVRNWDAVRGTFKPMTDDLNNFNRAKGDFDFDPSKGEARLSTPFYRNNAAITQAGREISKLVVFPNLYEIGDVTRNLKEILKLASAYSERIDVTLTPRALLLDVGDFVSVNVNIGSVQLDKTPAMIRTLGYDPQGLAIPVRFWSFQMVPFGGWSPGYSGITGGSTATITQET